MIERSFKITEYEYRKIGHKWQEQIKTDEAMYI
jgi:hypothetical protein